MLYDMPKGKNHVKWSFYESDYGLMTDLERVGLRQTQLMSSRGEIPNLIFALYNVDFSSSLLYMCTLDLFLVTITCR